MPKPGKYAIIRSLDGISGECSRFHTAKTQTGCREDFEFASQQPYTVPKADLSNHSILAVGSSVNMVFWVEAKIADAGISPALSRLAPSVISRVLRFHIRSSLFREASILFGFAIRH